jgi:hypothetical protein
MAVHGAGLSAALRTASAGQRQAGGQFLGRIAAQVHRALGHAQIRAPPENGLVSPGALGRVQAWSAAATRLATGGCCSAGMARHARGGVLVG